MDVRQLDLLAARIAALCPIDGLNWWQKRIDFKPEATAEQRAAARALLDAFDPGAQENQVPAPRDPLAEIDALKAALVRKAVLSQAEIEGERTLRGGGIPS